MTPRYFASIAMAVLLIAFGGYLAMTPNETIDDTPITKTTQSTARLANSEPAAGESAAADNMTAESETAEQGEKTEIDVGKAMAPRTMGAPDAPVVIEEYASLTCSHCAHFHEETFDQLKENFIDTGQVYFIFNDFPLNTPARDASMIARCLPQERYFKFIGFLFQTQDKWAYESDYLKSLTQNAKLLGATDQLLTACLQSDELKMALATSMQEASQKHQIRSTPSFVVNGEQVISGAQPYTVFEEIITKLLEESNTTE